MGDSQKSGLYCEACGVYLGGNNEPIKEGPHAGARPTDLTQYCLETGQQESVIESAVQPVYCGYCDHYGNHVTANCVLPIVN